MLGQGRSREIITAIAWLTKDDYVDIQEKKLAQLQRLDRDRVIIELTFKSIHSKLFVMRYEKTVLKIEASLEREQNTNRIILFTRNIV